MNEQENLRAAGLKSLAGIGNTCSRVSPRKMLLQQAEEFRRRAHDLEALAYHLPENMPESVEVTLANTLASALYR